MFDSCNFSPVKRVVGRGGGGEFFLVESLSDFFLSLHTT